MVLKENKQIFPRGEISIYQHIGGEFINGKVVGGKIISQHIDHNLIVDTASTLMACRMAPGGITGGSEEAFEGNFLDRGLSCLAVGHGVLINPTQPYDPISNQVDLTAWNAMDPPEPTLEQTKLVGEGYRKPFTSWCFQSATGEESETATNILLIDTTFYEDEANIPMSEIGLFGGDAVTTWNNGAGKDTGIMFNYHSFRVIHKEPNHRMSIRWKLTF